MIKQIYVDMDGVLCDFEKAAVEAKVLDLKSRKVDWPTLRALGTKFWAELEWINEGKKLYDFLKTFTKEHKIDLCILSSVASSFGKEGKKEWLSTNTTINPMNFYIVNKPADKKDFADGESILIDDYGKNIQEFIHAGGHGIKFKNNAEEVIEKVKELVSGDDTDE